MTLTFTWAFAAGVLLWLVSGLAALSGIVFMGLCSLFPSDGLRWPILTRLAFCLCVGIFAALIHFNPF
jgi:hypothetical protein